LGEREGGDSGRIFSGRRGAAVVRRELQIFSVWARAREHVDYYWCARGRSPPFGGGGAAISRAALRQVCRLREQTRARV
jgi:hypothetical protein